MSAPMDKGKRARIVATIRRLGLDAEQVRERWGVSKGLSHRLVMEAKDAT